MVEPLTDLPVDPRVALLWFAAVALLLAAIAWPRRGAASRVRRLLRMTELTQVEDAMKHLQNASRSVTSKRNPGGLEFRTRGGAVATVDAAHQIIVDARAHGTGSGCTAHAGHAS